MSYYPVALDLRGRACVVVGGGALAEQKVLGLLDAGARVTVISATLSLALADLARRGQIVAHQRGFAAGDLDGAWLAIAAAEDRSGNAAVWRDAQARGVFLNAVDDVPHCSFIAPAVHRVGDLTITVSTAGKSPALAVRLRERIAKVVRPEEAALLDLLGALRPEVARRVPDPAARARLWYRIVDSDVAAFVRRGDSAGARARIEELIAGAEPAAAAGPGTVYLVGAGPGHPELITLRGADLLRRADAVVYDRLVAPGLVELARHSAERHLVGKRGDGPAVAQEDITALLLELAARHQVVVRLKGGDPFVFGRGAEEAEALRAAGVPFEIVPGVTAAVAAPASAGIPVTHREHASGFAVITGHECAGPSDLDWEALARMPTLVVLMGLRQLDALAARLIAAGAAADTPAALIANGTLPDEQVVVATLGTIAAEAALAAVEPPATLVVGEVVRVRERLAALDASLV